MQITLRTKFESERMMSKKILHIITSLEMGGAQRVLNKLVDSDDKSNQHFIITLKKGPNELKPNCQVFSLDFGNLINAYKSMRWLLSNLKNERYSLIVSWLYHADLIGTFVSLLTKIPLIWNIRHTYIDQSSLKFTTWLIVRINFFVFGFVPRAIIYCAVSAKYSHRKLLFWKKPEVQINNGAFLPSEDIPIAPVSDRCTFIWVGRDDPQKGFEIFLKAVASLKGEINIPFHCNCYGNGIEFSNNRISQLINKLDVRDCVNLCGKSSHIDLEFRVSHVHVLSSLSEGFPNVVVEAMSNSVPSIVTEVGDAAVIVGDTGWIVSPGDFLELRDAMYAACMELVYENKIYINRRFSCFKRATNNFSLMSMLREYQKIFDYYGKQK